MVSRCNVRELGRVSAWRLVKVPLYSVFAVDEDTIRAGPAWSNGDMESLSTVATGRWQAYIVKKSYSLLDGIRLLPDFKKKVPKLPSVSIGKAPQPVPEKDHIDSLSAR